MLPLATLHLLSIGLAVGSTATPPRISAVVTDVDGTLFSFAGRDLSEGNRVALSECVESGVHVSLATGRIPGPWFDALKAQLPGLGPCVFGNGALVVDDSGTPIWEAKLSKEIVSSVLEYTAGGVADGGARLCVLAATRWEDSGSSSTIRYCELSPDGARSPITDLIDGAGEPPAVLLPSLDGFADRDVLKFVIWTVPGEAGWASMPSTVQALKARLADSGATILDHGSRWCEVLPRGVNKGTGVERMLAHLSVDPANALACGDAENDVEMLQICGIGAAMANAKPDALAAADVTVASNADDGVAEAIRRFVLPAR